MKSIPLFGAVYRLLDVRICARKMAHQPMSKAFEYLLRIKLKHIRLLSASRLPKPIEICWKYGTC